MKAGEAAEASKNARVNHQRTEIAGETDTQNLNKRSYNNNTQNQSIHLRGLGRSSTKMEALESRKLSPHLRTACQASLRKGARTLVCKSTYATAYLYL